MFKPFAIATLLMAVALPAAAETLTVNLTGLKPQGKVMVALYDSEAAYNNGKPLNAAMVEVSAESAQTTFDVPAGTYAIKAFHDENGNGKMDTNPFGAPVEPFAFSNNAKGSMGPAQWSAAAFAVEGHATQTLDF